ncbi:MAG TPA: protein-glutamate O-methyltransferase CheR [Firmicutes bacterium]|nr:protein-glutamate O-methyltransferase CheR [Bacillota bacterium]
MREDAYMVFCHKVKQLIGIDLTAYKDRQMKRRLGTFMLRLGVNDYLELAELIEKDREALDKFRNFLTINVSEFFRNAEQFEILKEKILPTFIDSNKSLRIWSAGCSDGSEPYTLVIILEELGVKNYELLASDIDFEILQRAKMGVYKQDSLRNVPPALLGKYFLKGEDELYQFLPSYTKKVKFFQHDLLKDRYERNLDLILCRNVVIYFTEEAKTRVFTKMSESLRQEGVLFVGGTESILAPKKLGLQTVYPFFYRKTGEPEIVAL